MPPSVKARLTSGPVKQTLIGMTGPMIIGIFGVIAMNLIDTYFLGRLGTRELAAISFTFPVVYFIGSIALGLGIGASAVISRAIGEGSYNKVVRLTSDGLALSVLIVTCFAVVGLFTIDPLFRMLGASEDLLPMIKIYMVIWYPGMAFLVIPMVGNNAIRATGDTKTPGLIMVIGVTVNLVLDPLLIFGIGPFPRWEMAGAAAATVIARAVVLFVSLYVLYYREKMVSFITPSLKEAVESWKKILYIGVPAAGTNLVIPLSLGIITRLISSYGKEAVAGFGAASRIEAFSLVVILALGSVLNPFIGQNWGAKEHGRVKRGIRYSHIFAMIWGAIIFVVFIFAAGFTARLFNDNPDVISVIKLYMYIISVSYGFYGVFLLSGSAFNALNKPYSSGVLSIIRTFIIYIPIAYTGSHYFGIKGIFCAAAAANIISGAIAFFWLKKTCCIEVGER